MESLKQNFAVDTSASFADTTVGEWGETASHGSSYYGEDAPALFAESIEREADSINDQTCVVDINEKTRLLDKQFDPDQVVPGALVEKPRFTTSHSLLIEEWEGSIKTVLEDTFIAHLYKPGNTNGEILEGEFEIRSVPAEDRHLIKEGILFYWNIGEEVKKNGEVSHVDYIIIRRFPTWKDFDINAASSISENFFESE